MAFRHNIYIKGATNRQILQAARRLKRRLVYTRKKVDLENETGLLGIASTEWPMDHLVVLKEGQVIDPDVPYATIWDVDVYLAAYKARVIGLFRLKTNKET